MNKKNLNEKLFYPNSYPDKKENTKEIIILLIYILDILLQKDTIRKMKS